MNVTCNIDSSGLNRALDLAQEFSKRTPAQACNTAALEVAIGAKDNMPVTTIGQVDYELDTIIVPKIGKRGKPIKGRRYGSGARPGEVPIAVLIIQARARPGSRYNVLTNNRYATSGSPFKGVSRTAGAAAMADAVHKMIAQRHSSVAFLRAGWIPAIRQLLPYSKNQFRQGNPKMDGGKYLGGDLGSATPATKGYEAVAIITNDIGYQGANAKSFDQALQKYGAPGLQRALDEEGVRAMNYYLKKSGSELEVEFNAAAK